ncbi:MAG: fibro-slime domain-containing protein [Fibrobacter sp.]|nr:fibro-slime domain-containing protein [Fibrobacter sp.]
MKKSAKRIVLAASMFGLAGVMPAQAIVAENQRELDIVVRDFDVSHPDFENFQEEATYSFSHPGDGKPNSWDALYQGNADWMARRSDPANYGCGNSQTPQLGVAIGTAGYPKDLMSQSGAVSTVPDYILTIPTMGAYATQGYAWYGEFSNCKMDPKLNPLGLKVMRGLVADLCTDASASWGLNMADNAKSCSGTKVCNTHSWSQVVYVTPGMVKQKLGFTPDAEGNLDMYEPKIERNRLACDNVWFDQWYSDDYEGSVTKRTNTTLILDQDPADTKYFEIDKNWNNGGYFPLDSIDANYNWVGPKLQYPNQFGAQSLSIFCPPYDYRYASSQTDFKGDNTASLCKAWKSAGGPKVGAAALAAAQSSAIGMRHLRNYGFTMMGYAAFKYKKGAGEIFKFTGDDDMWIYVDGVLVVDLGGTHLAAAGTADMDYLATLGHGCRPGDPLADSCATKLDPDGTWMNESWHHIHFFYADRQTDGSNLRIRSSLSELAPSRYGQPAANNVSVKTETDPVTGESKQTVSMLLNTSLDEATFMNLTMYGAEQPAVLVMRTEVGPDGVPVVKTYGYYITSIEPGEDKGAKGILYQMSGALKDAAGNVVETGILGSDMIAFNFPYNDEIANDEELKAAYVTGTPDAPGVGAAVWAELLQWNQKLTFSIKSSSGKAVVGFPDTPTGDDWAVVKFIPSNNPSFAPPDTTITRPDFGPVISQLQSLAGDGELGVKFTGDLTLTPLPATAGKGDPTKMSDDEYKLFGSSNPTDPAVSASRSTFVGGATGGAGATPGLCFAENGVESCTNFSKIISGPSRINVRVFDHMGHFVSQYQMEITEGMLQAALGKNPMNQTCADNSGKMQPVYGETGYMLMSAMMYPVSQDGRLLATGPYVYQVTVVEEKYGSCIVSNGSPQWMPVDYSRTSETYRRGYRRIGK